MTDLDTQVKVKNLDVQVKEKGCGLLIIFDIFLNSPMMSFLERFQSCTNEKVSLLCVGLDPDRQRLPTHLQKDPDGLFKFCAEIIDSTAGAAAAFKFNFAFFESAGAKGWSALERLLEIIPRNVITIADAKRGDIGNSSEMYARAILESLGFDAVTVNPFMGADSVAPFLQWPEKGAFVLCLTSNPGARDFQYFSNGMKTVYEKVLERVQEWNRRENCGLVVGATQPNELQSIRAAAPNLPFLVPGVGTQGGDLESAVRNGTTAAGELALFNVSRGVIYKSGGADFAEAAGTEAERIRDQINQARKEKSIRVGR